MNQVYYDAYPLGNGEVQSYRGSACFSMVYGRLKQYQKIVIYHPKKEYDKQVYGDEASVQGQDLEEFLNCLREWKFNFTYNADDVMCDENDNNKQPAYSYTIIIKENKNVANKILINCIRYTCEGNFGGIVRAFLKMHRDEYKGVNSFTKLMIAHQYKGLSNTNHTFVPYERFVKPITDEEFESIVLNGDGDASICNLLPQSKVQIGRGYYGNDAETAAYKPILAAFKENKSCEEIVKIYKKQIQIA